jgi:hypothetical protein
LAIPTGLIESHLTLSLPRFLARSDCSPVEPKVTLSLAGHAVPEVVLAARVSAVVAGF